MKEKFSDIDPVQFELMVMSLIILIFMVGRSCL